MSKSTRRSSSLQTHLSPPQHESVGRGRGEVESEGVPVGHGASEGTLGHSGEAPPTELQGRNLRSFR